MRLLPLALALAAGPQFAAAADSNYILIVPLLGTAQSVRNIQVDLAALALPPAARDTQYSVDLGSLLSIRGDDKLDLSLARWELVGGLPQGLVLNGSTITGVPVTHGLTSFAVRVTYKTKAGYQSYDLRVALNVELNAATFPESIVGQAITPIDFSTLIRGVRPSEVTSWSIKSGTMLPPGMTLNSATGVLSGIPTAAFAGDITIVAAVVNVTGEQSYQMVTRNIVVTQAAATLPSGRYNKAYTVNLSQFTSISGDPAYAPGAVEYRATSALPAGMSLTIAGVLTGTQSVPVSVGHDIQIEASYRGVKAQQGYKVPILTPVLNFGSYRAWADGKVATSCNGYRNASSGYVYDGDTGDGVYLINPNGSDIGSSFPVRCDQTTDGGGWTVIQRRNTGALGFYQGRAAYIAGFGNTAAEYWLGLDRIRALTSTGRELRIDLGRSTGARGFAKWSNFSIGAAPGYALGLGALTADSGVGDSLAAHRGHSFSTYDYDVDAYAAGNCAAAHKGAWWYTSCHHSNLNGLWLNGPHTSHADGMEWYTWTGYYESLTFSEMKVR